MTININCNCSHKSSNTIIKAFSQQVREKTCPPPPFLFTIYLNHLEDYLFSRNVNGSACDINYEDIASYLKILVLLYADDTVLFSISEQDMQYDLEVFKITVILGNYLWMYRKQKYYIAEQANKALFSLRKKITLELPTDIQLDLFEKL